MDHNSRTILVAGATGRQGGAAARHLLADGWHVRALVRDPHKPAAQELERLGAELGVGDLDDRASLEPLVRDAYGVFSMQTPPHGDFDAEYRQGANLADAAYEAGVEHFVYDSVRGADPDSSVAYMRPKAMIEQHIADLGLPATIWRPVSFMENFLRQRDDILQGYLRAPVDPEVIRQLIAADDIGKFVALAFKEPTRFIGITKEIASDEMTMPEAAALFSLVLDVPVIYEQIEPPPGMMTIRKPGPGVPPMAMADLEVLRELIPDLWTLEDWIRAQQWALEPQRV